MSKPKTRRNRLWERVGVLQTRIHDAVWRTKQLHLNAKQHGEEMRRLVTSSPEFLRLPQWAQWYVRGYEDRAFAEIQNAVEARWLLDGQWVTQDQVPANRWGQTQGCRHFWPGTDRPWGVDPTEEVAA